MLFITLGLKTAIFSYVQQRFHVDETDIRAEMAAMLIRLSQISTVYIYENHVGTVLINTVAKVTSY